MTLPARSFPSHTRFAHPDDRTSNWLQPNYNQVTSHLPRRPEHPDRVLSRSTLVLCNNKKLKVLKDGSFWHRADKEMSMKSTARNCEPLIFKVMAQCIHRIFWLTWTHLASGFGFGSPRYPFSMLPHCQWHLPWKRRIEWHAGNINTTYALYNEGNSC